MVPVLSPKHFAMFFFVTKPATVWVICCYDLLGQICQGRVSQSVDKGVMVDVGAYTERGEWVDAFLHMGQIKDDGGYIAHVGHLALSHNIPAISCDQFPHVSDLKDPNS